LNLIKIYDSSRNKSATIAYGLGGGSWPLCPPISSFITVLPAACGMASLEHEYKQHANTNTDNEINFFMILVLKIGHGSGRTRYAYPVSQSVRTECFSGVGK
jgi:hypothetical protein